MPSNPSQIANRNKSLQSLVDATAPAQFAVLANVTIPDAGFYRVKMTYGYGATSETTNANNFEFVVNNTLVTILPSPVAATNVLFPTQEEFLNLNAGDIVKIITANAGSAGSIYKTFLIVDKMS